MKNKFQNAYRLIRLIALATFLAQGTLSHANHKDSYLTKIESLRTAAEYVVIELKRAVAPLEAQIRAAERRGPVAAKQIQDLKRRIKNLQMQAFKEEQENLTVQLSADEVAELLKSRPRCKAPVGKGRILDAWSEQGNLDLQVSAPFDFDKDKQAREFVATIPSEGLEAKVNYEFFDPDHQGGPMVSIEYMEPEEVTIKRMTASSIGFTLVPHLLVIGIDRNGVLATYIIEIEAYQIGRGSRSMLFPFDQSFFGCVRF